MTSDEGTTNCELRTTNSEKMTPAMREWKRKIEAGYSIRPRLRVGGRGYVVWGPALFNPEGAFVQSVRRDTLRRLMRLGIVTSDERRMTSEEGEE